MGTYLVDNIYSNNTEEWYTPQEFTKAARRVLGSIDLDPASCALANKVIQATRYYAIEDDGLKQDWTCTSMWLNPPYGRLGTDRQKGQTELWVSRLIEEYEAGHVQEAILLVNAYLYKQWFTPLWRYLISFPAGRLFFWNAEGKHGRSPHSSALVYFGSREEKFTQVFREFGPIVKAVALPQEQVTLWDETEEVAS